MRKWLVNKLFSLALRIDEVETTILARLWVDSDNFNRMVGALIKDMTESIEKPKKRGRPKGRKDGVGPKPEAKKRGRPAKSDTWRTHAWVPGEEAAPKKRGRPLGSKNKPKETLQ